MLNELKSIKGGICCICLDDTRPPKFVALCCGCKFHLECLGDWLLHKISSWNRSTPLSCPLCRSEVFQEINSQPRFAKSHRRSFIYSFMVQTSLLGWWLAKIFAIFAFIFLVILYRECGTILPQEGLYWESNLYWYIECSMWTATILITAEGILPLVFG